jgi:membrane-bound lytic murein transglycosylase D
MFVRGSLLPHLLLSGLSRLGAVLLLSTAGVQAVRAVAHAASAPVLHTAAAPGMPAAPASGMQTSTKPGVQAAAAPEQPALVPIVPPTAGAALDRTFITPPPLRAAVDFWVDLFLQHGHDQVVVHDREHVEVIWKVLELPKDGHGHVNEAAAARLVKTFTDDLRQRLQRLQSCPQPRDEADRALLVAAAAGRVSSTEVGSILPGASTRLRTQRGVADDFRAGLKRSRAHLGAMRRIFAQEGVPQDLAVLPFVESMFNPQARSAVGAVGLWQLMPRTALGLGLRVSRRVDDRRDILKATRAAARLLRQNHRILGSWPLAITAYNHGAYSMKRAVQSLTSTDLPYLIAHYQSGAWGFSSKNFYAEFLAVRSVVGSLPQADGSLTTVARRGTL